MEKTQKRSWVHLDTFERTKLEVWRKEEIWDLGSPESVIVRSYEELDQKLLESLKDKSVPLEETSFGKLLRKLKPDSILFA